MLGVVGDFDGGISLRGVSFYLLRLLFSGMRLLGYCPFFYCGSDFSFLEGLPWFHMGEV